MINVVSEDDSSGRPAKDDLSGRWKQLFFW